MFYINIIKSYRDVVAICDSELLGKKFEENNLQLEVKENFYKGKEGDRVSEKEAEKIIDNMVKEDATFNIVGEKSIALALKKGIITDDGIKTIQGIPCALSLG